MVHNVFCDDDRCPRQEDQLSAALRHRPVQPAVPVLHAGGRVPAPSARGDPELRGAVPRRADGRLPRDRKDPCDGRRAADQERNPRLPLPPGRDPGAPPTRPYHQRAPSGRDGGADEERRRPAPQHQHRLPRPAEFPADHPQGRHGPGSRRNRRGGARRFPDQAEHGGDAGSQRPRSCRFRGPHPGQGVHRPLHRIHAVRRGRGRLALPGGAGPGNNGSDRKSVPVR